MNSEPGIGQFPPFCRLGFCSQVALSCEAGFTPPSTRKGESAGAERKERPPQQPT